MKKSILLLIAAALALPAEGQVKHIAAVEPVKVDTPVGTVPRLPSQLLVRYADGSSGWRQVVWNDASREVEAFLSDSVLHPAGCRYEVAGAIIGEGPGGFPVKASVRVTRASWRHPAPEPVASPLPLADVRLTGDNRLTSNRDMDIRNLLSINVKEMLYNYRDTYGLSTEGYPRSRGWDSPTTKLKGHGSGHYMSAMAMAYACCEDPALKDSLKTNIRIMVDQLRECQELTFVMDEGLGRYREARDLAPEEELRHLKGDWASFDEYKKDCCSYGYGYLNAIPAQHPVLVEMYRPYHNEQWVWAPYYSIHKQLAGLIDIALNVDDEAIASKAQLIARDMGLWVWNRLHYRTFVDVQGSREERRSRPGNRYEMWNMYIAGELGGMAESLSRLSEMSSDPGDRARLLEAASYFDAPAFFGPLSRNIDDIRGRHANQHIPMITGALRSYRLNADPMYYDIALNFWQLVQGRYVYATGGVGNGEMFREPYTQMRNMLPDPCLNETCCAYNLAKLTKDLNCYDPDDAAYMDYYERVLYNQIVGSLHPEHFAVTYQYAVGLNARKPFGNRSPSSTCCGGTGAENHVKYQEAAYFVSDDCLWVGLYLPTEAFWRAKGVTLTQECAWPSEHSVIKVSGGRFAMKLRVPYWATEGFDIRLNGRSIARSYRPCSYVEIPARNWSESDVVEVVMPYTDHICYGPDKIDGYSEWLGALMHGPLVMATPDAPTWEEAVYKKGSEGMTFAPDYTQTGNTTRYLRLPDGNL